MFDIFQLNMRMNMKYTSAFCGLCLREVDATPKWVRWKGTLKSTQNKPIFSTQCWCGTKILKIIPGSSHLPDKNNRTFHHCFLIFFQNKGKKFSRTIDFKSGRCGSNVGAMWEQYGSNVGAMWEQCGSNVKSYGQVSI